MAMWRTRTDELQASAERHPIAVCVQRAAHRIKRHGQPRRLAHGGLGAVLQDGFFSVLFSCRGGDGFGDGFHTHRLMLVERPVHTALRPGELRPRSAQCYRCSVRPHG